MPRPTAAIVGPGNIGTDLLVKLQRRDVFDVRYMIGVDPSSDGLARARELGVEASAEGVDCCWPSRSSPTSSSRPPPRNHTWPTPLATPRPGSGRST